MDNDWKKRLGVVYSTNEKYDFDYEGEETDETLPNNQQNLKVQLDRKNRKGKVVTLVSGYSGRSEDQNALAKLLKNKCGVGGSVKEEGILLQGDHREKVINILKNEGYKVKQSGG